MVTSIFDSSSIPVRLSSSIIRTTMLSVTRSKVPKQFK